MKQISKALNAYSKNKKKPEAGSGSDSKVKAHSFTDFTAARMPDSDKRIHEAGSAGSKPADRDRTLVKTTVSKPVFPSFVSPELQKSASSASSLHVKKVAKFLVIVGKDQAAEIMSHLPREQIDQILIEMGKIKRIYPEEREVLLKEFGDIKGSRLNDTGGTAFVADVLTKRYGREQANDIMKRICPEELIKPFEFLDDFTPSQIFSLIRDENPGVLSFILLQLERKKAAGILTKFSGERQKDLISRMKDFKSLDPEIAKHVISGIKHKAEELRESGDNLDIDGGDILGRILSHMKDGQEGSILKSLDPELSSRIEEQIYTVDLVYRVSSSQLETILNDFDDQEIVYLLQAREERFIETLLSSVSKNRRIYIEAAIEKPGVLSPIEKKAVERDFIKAVRTAIDENEDSI